MSNLNDTTLGQLSFDAPEVIYFKNGTPVSNVLEEFAKHEIISAPIKNAEGAFVGVINLIDIICFISQASTPRFSVPVSELLGLSTESRGLAAYDATDRVKTALKSLSTSGPGRHLALVLGKNWHRVITQSDVLRFIYSSSDLNSCPSKDLPICKTNVGVVEDDEKKLKKFTRLKMLLQLWMDYTSWPSIISIQYQLFVLALKVR